MIVFNDVVQVIQNLVKQRRNGADTDITQLLLPVLFATSPDEDLDLSICSLYRGVFENNLEYLIDSKLRRIFLGSTSKSIFFSEIASVL